jgi:hypothetical protein
LLGFVAIEQHPQILNRWPHTRIIEIDKQRAITPENITGMTIAMQAQDEISSRQQVLTAAISLSVALRKSSFNAAGISADVSNIPRGSRRYS